MILKPGNSWGRLQGLLKLTPEQALRMFGFIMDPEAEGVIFRQYVYLDDILRPHTATFISNYKPPTNPNTPAQKEQRKKLTDAVKEWHKLHHWQQAAWEMRARRERLQMSGFNLWNREFMLAV